MKVAKDLTSGRIRVEYCETHAHPTQLGHLPLSEQMRLLIAQKLKDGVTIDKVLDDLRDEIPGTVTRKDIITKQDIRNIKRQYNIGGVQRHKEDQLSVCAWVEEMEALDNNPIIAFKPQGKECDGSLGVGRDDFILAIQTQFQRQLLATFGANIICMDATHKTNQYDFKLVTLIVIDEYGEGQAVAWMISNKEDGGTLCEFLRAIYRKTGVINPKYFMTDDAEQYFSAWVDVFGGQPIKLLCSWHVDRAWRKNLGSTVAINYGDCMVQKQIKNSLLVLEISDLVT